MVRENIYNKKIPKYSSVNIILKHFNIHEKQLENILLEMEKNQRLAYTYYYGINRPKLDLEDISEMLQVSENVVKIYINQADDFIQRNCQSFFDYFDKKDHASVLEIIEQYKKLNHDYYKVLVKEYGEHYDCLVVPSLLTKEEKVKLNNFRASIRNRIKKDDFSVKPRLNKAQSFFDYFDKKDHASVLEIIEQYKKLNHDYYKVLVKEYGEHYNCLVVPSPLTKKEQFKLNNFRTNIRNRIKKDYFLVKPRLNKAQSFFDYFDKKDYDSVLKIIEEYKEKDSDYYKLLVKEYGEHYDCLVVQSVLNKKEKKQLNSFRQYTRNRIKNSNSVKNVESIKFQSFFNYFDKKDYDSVLKIIGEYKEKDSNYYKLLVKEYGEHYNCLVVPSPLTKKEQFKLNNFRTNIRNRIKKDDFLVKPRLNKAQGFFDYFDKKDYDSVLKIIEEYKEKDSDYYKLLVKEYGEHYDCLVVPSLLTKEEKVKLKNFRASIRNRLKKGDFLIKPKSTKSQSFFDYFDKKDYDLVLKIIEEYKKENHDYYKVLVKEYGEHYDCLVVPSHLTKKEQFKLINFRTSIRNKIKNGNVIKKSEETRKQSFFDYFDQKNYDLVLKIIEEYKKENHDYYKVLVKEYGEHYDCLSVPSPLTKKEKMQLNNFRTNIRNRINNGIFLKKPRSIKEQSFFDYFDKKDHVLVLEIIEEYKRENHDYYKVLVKEYGEHYDCLVVPSCLTKKEKQQLDSFKACIKNRIKKGDMIIKSGPTKIQSFFDYFDKNDHALVLGIIEEYKKINHDYYKVLVKEFGDTYDCLVEPSLLTELDMIYLNNFRIVIVNKIHKKRKKSGPNKKQSFFDYFAQQDKNFVLKIIEKYKEKDSNYYKVLVKEYGEHYDCLVVPSRLTKKEQNQLDNFKITIRKELQNNNLFVKSPEIQTSQNEDFNYDLSMSYIYRRFPNLKQEKDADLIILTSFIDKKKSVELISNLTKFSMKKIDFILLKHLYVFSFKMPVIIDEILRRGSYTVSQVVNFNYIQTQVSFLNDKEKELLYLKMEDLYQNQLSKVLEFSDKEIKDKIQASQNEDFNYDFSMSYIYRRFPNLKQEKDADLIILTNFIDKKKSVESISNLTKISIKKIDFILLKYLYVFSFKMSVIIDEILRRGNYTISQLVNFNYIQTQAPFLNDKEKELIYLKIADLYQNQLSDILKFSDKEMKYKMKTLKFENFN